LSCSRPLFGYGRQGQPLVLAIYLPSLCSAFFPRAPRFPSELFGISFFCQSPSPLFSWRSGWGGFFPDPFLPCVFLFHFILPHRPFFVRSLNPGRRSPTHQVPVSVSHPTPPPPPFCQATAQSFLCFFFLLVCLPLSIP